MAGTKYLALGKQTLIGTSVAYTDYCKIRGDTVKPRLRPIYEETVERRELGTNIELSNYLNDGEIVSILRGDTQDGNLLMAAMGVDTLAAGGTTAKRHQLRLASSLPFYTVGLGAEQYERKLVGIACNGARLRSNAGEYLLGTFIMLGGGAIESRVAIGTPTFGTRQAFKHMSCTVSINAVQREAVVKSFEVSWNNNIPIDALYGANSKFIQRLEAAGMFEPIGRIEADFESGTAAALYDLMIAGTPFAIDTIYLGQSTGDATFANDRLRVYLPRCIIPEDAVPDLERQSRLSLTIPFKAVYDSTQTFALGLDLDNTRTTVY